jgi:hypothetical protein
MDNKQEKGFFQILSDKCTELSDIAQKYLDTMPFITNEECSNRIWSWACSQMDTDENGYFIFNGKNEFAEEIVDGGIPFAEPPRNGSLHYSLGWSITAQEANLRSLLEFLEGRQSEWVKFKCLVGLDEVK